MGGESRVIKFEPRKSTKPRPTPLSAGTPDADDLSPVESRSKSEADDYRRRMWMNFAALVFTLLLTGLGVWLATTIADLRQTQDCLLVGRRDCGRIPVPIPSRPRPGESI